jgi:alkylhydroperoxidase/carboxymuconolactone decarboxylase family protein YurZ
LVFDRYATTIDNGGRDMMDGTKVTAGRDQLGDFAPQFAAFNDDLLFGQVWSRDKELSARDRQGKWYQPN